MTFPSQTDVVVSAVPAEANDRSYVDWPAIIAGIALASAISIVLLAFGSAIGLSFTNFNAADDVPTIWIAIAAASWLLWVQISSFMAGGYITGRLRKRHGDASEEESDVRDGAHGLLVWAGALIVGAVIAVGGLNAAATTVGNVAGAVTNAASNVAAGAAEGAVADPNAYFTDMLFRPVAVGTAAPAADAAATPAAPADSTATATGTTTTTAAPAAAPVMATSAPAADNSALRAEAGRIFVQSALSGELPADDRTYLAQAVAANTGMSQADAEARVDQVVTAMDAATAKAAEVAEAARKMTVLAAFLTAASLLVSAVGAYWAAQKGGNHRDKNADFSSVFRRW